MALSDSGTAAGRIVERREGDTAILTLARPEFANSYTEAMLGELYDAIERAEADDSLKVIVVTGAGERVFCAGADKTELRARRWQTVSQLPAARTFARLQRCKCLSIAAINGAAVGGGLELALHCDIRIASESANFWLPEPELGLLPAAGGLRLLPEIVGLLRSKDLILGGAQWNAYQAYQSGLISDVAAHGQLWSKVSAWIQQIARRDLRALTWAKALLNATAESRDSGLDRLAQSALVMMQTPADNSDVTKQKPHERKGAGYG